MKLLLRTVLLGVGVVLLAENAVDGSYWLLVAGCMLLAFYVQASDG